MKNNTGFLQAYNAQTVVDDTSQVIIAEALTNQAPDQQHLQPMMDRAIANCGEVPVLMSADNGYYSKDNIDACEQHGIDPYISVGRKSTSDSAPAEGTNESPTPVQLAKQHMRAKLKTKTGKAIYARRKVIVEPPFGQIKEVRGFRRFSMRGIAKARPEWTLVCLTHNLLKLFRATRSAKSTGCAPVAMAAA